MTGRSCRLLFQGSPRILSPVSDGTPQGSPVFSSLLVIYVAPLHLPLSRGLVLSYVDDFTLTVSFPSYRTNSRSLPAAFGRIRAIAHSRKVDFSVLKTELIHWRSSLQPDTTGTPSSPPVTLDGQIFHPSKSSASWATGLFRTLPHPLTSRSVWHYLKLPFPQCDTFPRKAKSSPPIYATCRLLLNVSYRFIWCRPVHTHQRAS